MALSDKEASEIYFARYEPEPVQSKIERHAAQERQLAEQYLAKPLDVRKAEYEAYCAQFGFTKKQIEAGWEQYLKTGKM